MFKWLGDLLGGRSRAISGLTAPPVERGNNFPTFEKPGNLDYTKPLSEKAPELTDLPELDQIREEWVADLEEKAKQAELGAVQYKRAVDAGIRLGNAYTEAFKDYKRLQKAEADQGVEQYKANATYIEGLMDNEVKYKSVDLDRSDRGKLRQMALQQKRERNKSMLQAAKEKQQAQINDRVDKLRKLNP